MFGTQSDTPEKSSGGYGPAPSSGYGASATTGGGNPSFGMTQSGSSTVRREVPKPTRQIQKPQPVSPKPPQEQSPPPIWRDCTAACRGQSRERRSLPFPKRTRSRIRWLTNARRSRAGRGRRISTPRWKPHSAPYGRRVPTRQERGGERPHGRRAQGVQRDRGRQGGGSRREAGVLRYRRKRQDIRAGIRASREDRRTARKALCVRPGEEGPRRLRRRSPREPVKKPEPAAPEASSVSAADAAKERSAVNPFASAGSQAGAEVRKRVDEAIERGVPKEEGVAFDSGSGPVIQQSMFAKQQMRTSPRRAPKLRRSSYERIAEERQKRVYSPREPRENKEKSLQKTENLAKKVAKEKGERMTQVNIDQAISQVTPKKPYVRRPSVCCCPPKRKWSRTRITRRRKPPFATRWNFSAWARK